MERLGVMYMMKIRYGNDFANRAGNMWRLVFTLALMPWLQRYRLYDSIPSESKEELKTITEKPTEQEENDTQKLMSYIEELEKLVGEDEKTRLREQMKLTIAIPEAKDEEEIKTERKTKSTGSQRER